MSWVEVKDINNKTFVIPESVFKNSYEKCGVFKKVEKTESKPKSVKSEVDNGSEIQLDKQTEINNTRKSNKKTSV